MTKDLGRYFDRRQALTGALAAGVAMPFISRTGLAQSADSIRIWTFMSAEGQSPREKVFKALIDEFQAKHKTRVVVEAQPFQELETKFVAAVAQRRAPDLVWLRDTFLSLVVDRNGLADLDQELTPQFRQQALPDMFDVFTRKSVFNGKRVSLPLWPSPAQIIFYRKDALREIGLSEPPLEWGGFVEAAAKLSKGNRIGFGLPTSDNSVSAFINIMSGFGPEIFDPATGKLDLTGPQAVETAQTVRKLVAGGAVSKTLLNAMGDDIQDQFAAGRFAMAQAFAPRFQQYQKIAAAYDPKELAPCAWPSFEGRPPAVLLGPYWTVGLAATSQNKPAAVAFLETLYSPEASMKWAKEASLIPDRRSVMSDPWFQTPAAAVTAEFFKLLSGKGAFVFPQRVPDITKIFTVLNTSLQEIIGTDEAVPAVLARAKSTLGW
ncbi:ABC transporter substrate-binding protein [Bosea sp. (in: a-proteobacteria)]|jgi:multiple sugar transport system substrate-binding protein|uniref:ABC transporter substrate-binding protein n=1 Tax=Bosea sp. (in: a-proteobacteria) TaxID=1871050 RepID=UPI003F6FD49E